MRYLPLIVALVVFWGCDDQQTKDLESTADAAFRELDKVTQTVLNRDDAQDLLVGERSEELNKLLEEYRDDVCGEIGSLHGPVDEEADDFASRAARVDCRKLVDKGLLGPIKMKREVIAELAKLLPAKRKEEAEEPEG